MIKTNCPNFNDLNHQMKIVTSVEPACAQNDNDPFLQVGLFDAAMAIMIGRGSPHAFDPAMWGAHHLVLLGLEANGFGRVHCHSHVDCVSAASLAEAFSSAVIQIDRNLAALAVDDKVG